MKKGLIILVAALLVGILGWFLIVQRGNEPATVENMEPQDFPARYDEVESPYELTQYTSEFGNLSFEYPENWSVVEGGENTADEQLLTVESPLDQNEFYFCLDIYRVGAASVEDFTITDADILATKQLQDSRNSVTYDVEELDGLYWGVTEETPQTGDNSFVNEISNQSGERLQSFGRFNCRETENRSISVEEFSDSRWLHEAEAMMESLDF